MPKISKDTAPRVDAVGPVEVREGEAGGYTVDFLSFAADVDGAPLLAGLPDDRCQCAHWGYVLKGRVRFSFADHEETFAAGDAFYLPPGHAPFYEAGVELVHWSPTEDARIVGEAMKRNLEALQSA